MSHRLKQLDYNCMRLRNKQEFFKFNGARAFQLWHILWELW